MTGAWRWRGVILACVFVAALAAPSVSLTGAAEPTGESARAIARLQTGPPRESRLPEIAGLAAALALLLLSRGAKRRSVRRYLAGSSTPAASPMIQPGLGGSAAWRLGPWLVIAVFTAVEAVLIASSLGGPTIDEGMYIAAGLRTLGGHGLSDSYLTWFSGSLLWPALAGGAYKLSGLEGARLLALACVVWAMIATIKATGNLFGARARFFTALILATSGPVLMLAHLAVYDTLAVAGVATSFWCLTELARRDHRGWLVAAALSFSVAVLAKYPTLFFSGFPLVAVLVVLRKDRARTDLAVFGFVGAALPMILFLSERGQFSELLTNPLALQTESFGASPRTVAYAQLYFTAVPAVLALAGWLAAPGRRLLATALLSGMVGPVAYHLSSQNGVSDHKHVVFGIIFAAPLGGLALRRAFRDVPRRMAMVPALGALAFLGITQMDRLDQGSPDLRPAVAYLRAHVKPGQELLINNSWPFIPYLYDDGAVSSPWDVYDVYRVHAGQARRSVCDFDWFVEAPGSSTWPERVQRRAKRCHTFREVFDSREPLVGLSNDRLDFIKYTGYATIWKNVGRRRSG